MLTAEQRRRVKDARAAASELPTNYPMQRPFTRLCDALLLEPEPAPAESDLLREAQAAADRMAGQRQSQEEWAKDAAERWAAINDAPSAPTPPPALAELAERVRISAPAAGEFPDEYYRGHSDARAWCAREIDRLAELAAKWRIPSTPPYQHPTAKETAWWDGYDAGRQECAAELEAAQPVVDDAMVDRARNLIEERSGYCLSKETTRAAMEEALGGGR